MASFTRKSPRTCKCLSGRLTRWSIPPLKPCGGGLSVTSRETSPDVDRELPQRLVDAFVTGGKVKPVLPEGRREEVLAVLTRLMVNSPLLDAFTTALDAERRSRAVHKLLLE